MMLLVNINDYSIVCGGSYFHVNTPAISHLAIADHDSNEQEKSFVCIINSHSMCWCNLEIIQSLFCSSCFSFSFEFNESNITSIWNLANIFKANEAKC